MKLDDAYFDRFTPEEYEAACPGIADRPTHEEVLLGWALPLLERSEVEQRVLIAAKLDVLAGIVPDPVAWCVEALKLAREERSRHAH